VPDPGAAQLTAVIRGWTQRPWRTRTLGPLIRIAAAVIVDAHDRVFLARKPGASAFMQPGVKVMPRDSAVEALQREIAEELDLVVAASPRS